MTKQNQPQPQQKDPQQQQNTSRRGQNPDQQGGQKSQGQPGANPGSQGQPGARQSDQGSGNQSAGSRGPDSQKGSQRGQTPNQQGSNDDDNESPEMNQAGEQSADRLRQGALDTQYGTSSSSKTDKQTTGPQGSNESTGSDRDTLSGSRNKGR